MSSSEKDAAEHKLMEFEALVRTMCRDLDPGIITKDDAPFIDSKLDEISDAKDKFRKSVRAFLKNFGLTVRNSPTFGLTRSKPILTSTPSR